jgi:hypothetical protein
MSYVWPIREVDGAQDRGVRDGGRELGEGDALRCEPDELGQRLRRIGLQDGLGQFGVAVPDNAVLTSGPRALQLGRRVADQRGDVDRVAPRRGLLHALRADERRHEGGQHLAGVLPADQVEQLERLVGEVQGVAGVQVQVVRARREDQVRDRRRLQALDRRHQQPVQQAGGHSSGIAAAARAVALVRTPGST